MLVKSIASPSRTVAPGWLTAEQTAALSLSGVSDTQSVESRITPFQKSVYTALCRVPAGSVTTYRHLAQSIHCGSSQAVGQALRRNPYAPVVPCHRVVASNRTLGGFHGQRAGPNVDRKRQLLLSEGVLFDCDGKVEASCIFDFSGVEKGRLLRK